MPRKIKLPKTLPELLRSPDAIQQLEDAVNALLELNVILTTTNATAALVAGKRNIIGEAPALTLPLPLRLQSPISDSTATAASASAQLNELLAALRRTGQLPS